MLCCALVLVLQERNDALEKAFTEAQAQAAHHREQMAEMQDSLKKATKLLQVSQPWTCAHVAQDASFMRMHAHSRPRAPSAVVAARVGPVPLIGPRALPWTDMM